MLPWPPGRTTGWARRSGNWTRCSSRWARRRPRREVLAGRGRGAGGQGVDAPHRGIREVSTLGVTEDQKTVRAPAQTGKVLWMRVPYQKGVANRWSSESCAVAREGGGEALTGVRAGWVLSRENSEPSRKRRLLRGADAVDGRGRQHRVSRHRERRLDPARSKTPRMHASTLHGSREIPRLSAAEGAADRIGKSKDVIR